MTEMILFYDDHMHVTDTERGLMCWAYGSLVIASFITLIRIIILILNMSINMNINHQLQI